MANKSKSSPNDDLVDALESIRGLLEKSETKLSAARTNLAKAKSPPFEKSPTRKYKKPPVSNEPVVPVLDDIVLKGNTGTDFEDEPTQMDIPSLDLNDVVSNPNATTTAIPTGHTTEEVLGYINRIESSLEARIHSTLLDTLVKVEMDVKRAVEEELENLRKLIKDK